MANSNSLPWAGYSRIQGSNSKIELQRHRSCPLCDQDDTVEKLALNDFQFFDDCNASSRITHRVVQCQHCGMLYTNPCYTAEGFRVLFAKAGQSYGHSEGRCQEQADWLMGAVPDCNSVVDIGCSSGDFLAALPNTIARTGLDIDTPSIDSANTKSSNIEFITADYSAAFVPPAAQVYTLFHVLEHLPDPALTLRQLRNVAGESTQLVVEVPVIERAPMEQAQDIVGFFTVQHLSHFSRSTLGAMLKTEGWCITKAESIAGYNGYRVLTEPCTPELSPPNSAEQLQSSADLDLYMQIWQQNIARVQVRLSRLVNSARVMIWGAGQHTEYLALLTTLFTAERRYLLLDRDPLKQGTTMHGISIIDPDSVDDRVWCEDDAPVVISTYGGQDAVYEELIRRGVAEKRIVKLYDVVNRY